MRDVPARAVRGAARTGGWPVAVRLRHSQRVDRAWLEAPCSRLSSPSSRIVLEGLLGHPDARTRLMAYAVALHSHPDRAALRVRAILDSDPHISHLALADLLHHGEPADVEAKCALALSAPASGVRSAALRALVEREVAGLDAHIETAAFDRSRGVRRLAMWLLQQRQATPAIALWRDELKHRRRARWREALEALADHAEAEDMPALRALLPQYRRAISATACAAGCGPRAVPVWHCCARHWKSRGGP